jgi:hypothetical protein
VKGSVSAVKQVGGDTVDATKLSVVAALEAAESIGSETADSVKSALSQGVDGAKGILDNIKK